MERETEAERERDWGWCLQHVQRASQMLGFPRCSLGLAAVSWKVAKESTAVCRWREAAAPARGIKQRTRGPGGSRDNVSV